MARTTPPVDNERLRVPSSHDSLAYVDILPRTKFFIPPARPRLVARTRLIEQLRDDAAQPLVLVAPPAGFGKTTLIVDWIAADRRAAAWLALDASDNDPMR